LSFNRALMNPLLLLTLSLTACAQQDSAQQRPPSALAQPSASHASPTPTSTPSPAATPRATRTPTVRLVDVTYTGGNITGADQRIAVKLGERVVLRFTSDVVEEIHVHGYDLYADLIPGQPAEIAFTADIPGVFEVELHNAGRPLYQLRVA
jgi:hypothetical protein